MKNDYPSMLHPYTIKRQSYIVIMALSPFVIMGVIRYGIHVVSMLLVAFVSALFVELLFSKFRKQKLNVQAFITPLIFTLVLPPTLPLWMVAVGSSFGVFFGKDKKRQ